MTPQTTNLEADAPRTWTEPPTPVPQELPAGTVLHGTYTILHPIGEGGCGAVYAAAHTRLPGQFAVKVLHRGLVRNLEAMSRFRHEAEITSTLRHPHIVQVLDFNVTPEGFPYLVMELLDGQSLATRLAEGGSMDPAAAVDIVEQIAQALHAAHARGIVHRDLKPDNIMLLSGQGMHDFVKVLDFGISQASWRPRLTDSAHVTGTPQYMAPEQACGLRDVIGPWTDQFSLAAITYTLLTGREPFTAEDPIAVLYQVVHHDPPPPSQHRQLAAAVDTAVMRGLAKQPADRFPDVLAFAQALRLALTSPTTIAAPVLPAPEPLAVMAVGEADLHHPETSEPLPAPAAAFEPPLRPFDAPRPVPPEPPPVPPAGRQTARLIRKVRRRIHRGPARVALLAVVAAAAVFCLSPRARVRGTHLWQQAQAHAQKLVALARR